MKVAYFDCQFGAAGDMLNAALLHAGADEDNWRKQLGLLNLPEGSFTAKVSNVMRCQIACKKVDVFDFRGNKFDEPQKETVSSARRLSGPSHESSHRQDHKHKHEHGREHDHDQAQDQDHTHGEGDTHAHRGLVEIEQLIEDSGIGKDAKRLSRAIFRRLAQAEAKVHAVSPEAVHFHEVGAVDAIVDICGFAIAYTQLGVEKSFASAVAVGSGKVRSAHGHYPVPGPATGYLLQDAGAAIANSTINFECLTPTGAAILCEVVSQWGSQPGLARVLATGYGAGTKDPEGWPNACRVMIAEASADTTDLSSRFDSDTVIVFEANIDDLNPQALAFAMDRLLEAGALDVAATPALMKKGRAGQLLTVLCHRQNGAQIEQIILTQTSTIGVRQYEARRSIARRQFAEVKLEGNGAVRIKLAYDNKGVLVNAQPEYEDCAAYALKHGLPLKDVINQALAAYFNGLAKSKS